MLVFGEVCKVHPETTYGYKDTWQRQYALDRPEERGKERGGRRQDHLQPDIGTFFTFKATLGGTPERWVGQRAYGFSRAPKWAPELRILSVVFIC